MLPTPPAEIGRPERLSPIVKGDLAEYVERHAEAAGAVERGNNHIAEWKRWAACVRAIYATGSAGAGC